MKLHKWNILFIIFFFCVLTNCWGSDKKINYYPPKDTIQLLLVGNSLVYYNNLAQMIGLITDSIDTKIIARKSTVGSATFSEHWNSKRGLRTRQIITAGKFNAIALQDHSMAAWESVDSMFYYGKKLAALVQERGARLYYYNTFANDTTPEKQRIIDSAYQMLAKQTNGINVPVGPCFALAKQLNPTIQLHYTDHRHPSELGSFLAALAFIKTLTGTLPKNYPTVYNYIDKDGETFRIMQLTEKDIRFCVQIVNEIIPSKGVK
jgi:hypothetical protein